MDTWRLEKHNTSGNWGQNKLCLGYCLSYIIIVRNERYFKTFLFVLGNQQTSIVDHNNKLIFPVCSLQYTGLIYSTPVSGVTIILFNFSKDELLTTALNPMCQTCAGYLRVLSRHEVVSLHQLILCEADHSTAVCKYFNSSL